MARRTSIKVVMKFCPSVYIAQLHLKLYFSYFPWQYIPQDIQLQKSEQGDKCLLSCSVQQETTNSIHDRNGRLPHEPCLLHSQTPPENPLCILGAPSQIASKINDFDIFVQLYHQVVETSVQLINLKNVNRIRIYLDFYMISYRLKMK